MGSSFSFGRDQSKQHVQLPSESFIVSKPVLRFYVLADFGENCDEVRDVAAAMNRYATEMNLPPDFIVGLGDNFYPFGVSDVTDPQFQSTWRNNFLKPFPSLRVPWRMLLGNHDYMGNPFAQLDYHDSYLNSEKLWYMPAKNYKFSYSSKPSEENPDPFSVDFFAVDTNGCQNHVICNYPGIPNEMHRSMKVLTKELSQSKANWKFVLGHHPMYTQGLGHSAPAEFLRDETKQYYGGQFWNGYGLENILRKAKVDCYFAGHEHVFQYHHAYGIHHFGCGAGGADLRPQSHGLFAGANPNFHINWIAPTGLDYGFVCVEILSQETMKVKYLNKDCQILKEIVVDKSKSSSSHNNNHTCKKT